MYFKPGDHHFGRHVHKKLDEFAFYGVHKKDRESSHLRVCRVAEVACAIYTSFGNCEKSERMEDMRGVLAEVGSAREGGGRMSKGESHVGGSKRN